MYAPEEWGATRSRGSFVAGTPRPGSVTGTLGAPKSDTEQLLEHVGVRQTPGGHEWVYSYNDDHGRCRWIILQHHIRNEA